MIAALTVRDLVMEYGSGDYKIRPLDGLSLAAHDGELVVLLGPSGCGKTTLLSCLAGLLTPTSGTIRYGDIEVSTLSPNELISYRRRTVGIVFQAFNLVNSLTARENVMAPMILTGTRDRAAADRAGELLDRVGLSERAHSRPAKLSGGQQQRVAIARALVHDPPLLLADEPTAHLDHVQVEGVLRLLRGLAVPGRLVLVSTHDDRVTRLADRVIELAPRGAAPMATEIRAISLEAGEVLFQQGDPSDLVYVIEEGTIELYREDELGARTVVARRGPGRYFGELGPLLSLPRSASASAAVPTRLTGYPLHHFSRRFPSIRLGMEQAQSRGVRCTRGHRTVPAPPGGELLRLECGCALATASDEALIDQFGRVLSAQEREQEIVRALKARRGQAEVLTVAVSVAGRRDAR